MWQWSQKRRLDGLEVLLLCVAVATATMALTGKVPDELRELQTLETRYGPQRQSEHFEEWIIRDYFNDKRDGFFVDVGANDYRRFSNTYYLETALGWSGIAVEPQGQFEAGYAAHRQRTRFRQFFVSNASNGVEKLYVGSNSLVASAQKDFTRRYVSTTTEMSVPTITLDDLLDRENVASIDLLTMDIELWEPKALAGFDIGRFRPALVCVEAHPEVRQQILEYFARHRYVVVGKYLRADTHNLYFAPMS